MIMNKKKTWFIGYNPRLWVPVSLEGWLVTVLFFVGIVLIGKINNVTSDASVSLGGSLSIVIEFIVLLLVLFFLTKGHVDKRY